MVGWLNGPSEHKRVEALLSPYLDGRVTQTERALVERHLQACSECSHSLSTLRATVTAVREMPHVRAPRSFALPRSMAKQPQTKPWLVPVLRAATAVATLLLVITVAGELFLGGMTVPAAAPVAFAPVAQESSARSVLSATSQAAAQDLSAPGLGSGGAAPPPGASAVAPLPLLASPAPTQAFVAQTSVQVTPTMKNTDAAASVPPPTARAQATVAPPAALGASAAPSPAAKLSAPQIPMASPTAAPTQLSAPKQTAPEPTPTTGARPEGAPVAPPPTIAPAQPTEAAYAVPAPVAQTPSADQAQTESQAVSQTIAWRIAEGLLAVLAIASGVAAWIVHRRNR